MREVESKHAELQTARASFSTATNEEIGGLLGAKKEGRVILSYLVGARRTILFLFTAAENGKAAEMQVRELDVAQADLYDLVLQFRESCGAADGRGARTDVTLKPPKPADPIDTVEGQAKKLYDMLLKPVEDSLAGKTQLIISTDDVLSMLPFQALMSADGKFVVENYVVSYAPSVTALLKMSSPKTSHGEGTLVVGNPEMPPGFRALPHAGEEASAVAAAEGTKALIGSEATETAVKRAILRANRIYFATHGVLNEKASQYSELVFSPDSQNDGLLQAREILNLDLSASEVVLSACQTALGQRAKGEGVLGLCWSFFVSGVPSCVVSLWSVDDRSTALLMQEYYRRLKEPGQTKAGALALAQRSLLGGPNGAFRHPYHWAPFVLIGNWK
jgi:CHAT domain-containing protein